MAEPEEEVMAPEEGELPKVLALFYMPKSEIIAKKTGDINKRKVKALERLVINTVSESDNPIKDELLAKIDNYFIVSLNIESDPTKVLILLSTVEKPKRRDMTLLSDPLPTIESLTTIVNPDLTDLVGLTKETTPSRLTTDTSLSVLSIKEPEDIKEILVRNPQFITELEKRMALLAITPVDEGGLDISDVQKFKAIISDLKLRNVGNVIEDTGITDKKKLVRSAPKPQLPLSATIINKY